MFLYIQDCITQWVNDLLFYANRVELGMIGYMLHLGAIKPFLCDRVSMVMFSYGWSHNFCIKLFPIIYAYFTTEDWYHVNLQAQTKSQGVFIDYIHH